MGRSEKSNISCSAQAVSLSLSGVVITERAGPANLPEDTFLQRLLEKGATESSNSEESSLVSAVEAGLNCRKAATLKTMKCVLQAIDVQRSKNDELAVALRNIVSPHGKFLPGYLVLGQSFSCASPRYTYIRNISTP